ncbi:MAG TPA: alpha/beta hydrolase [Solirubrobacteraceae bacterium]|jgi:pimeloyl-ACP methyl ester carboxylesterase
MPVVRAHDIDLHVEERGEGPALLLIAGIPALASDWSPLAERLAARRRVIAYDNRGSGASTVTPGPYTTRQLAADAVALLDALGIERADVFGMSLGGMIAQELALGWPERVSKLVLGCTHAGLRHAARQPREAGRAFALETDDWPLRMRTLAPFAFTEGVDPELLARFIEKKSREAFFIEAPDETERILEEFLG